MAGAQGLTGRALLVLQLLENGYSREQIARLVATTTAAVTDLERAARAALGADDTPQARAAAVGRGLIRGRDGGAVRGAIGGAGHVPGQGLSQRRYAAREDPAGGGFRVHDAVTGRWVARLPAFAERRLADDAAETLNQQELARQQRHWLHGEDRTRGRK